MKIFLFAVLLIGGMAGRLGLAEEETFSVKAEVDKAVLTIGERVEYRVTVTHDPSVEIVSKIVSPPSDVFEVKEVHDFSEKQGKQMLEGRRFVLTTYELGEFILEPVTISYKTPQGEKKSAETNRIYLTVQSVEPKGKPKTDIRGPRGVLELRRQWGWLWGLLGGLLALGGGIWGGWRWKYRPLEAEKSKEPPLSPEDEALLALNRLFDSDLIRRGKLKEYFLELSMILRRYFERRFEILAVESTTSEILRDLREKELPQTLREKIRQILESADLVKFAKWKPSPSEMITMNQAARALIEETRPRTPVAEETPSTAPHGV